MSEKEKSNKFSGGGVKPFGKVWKKWWFWALIVAVLIGGVIEFTEPETEEPTTATAEPTTEPTATKEPETEKSEVTKEPETEKNSTEEIKDITAEVIYEGDKVETEIKRGKTTILSHTRSFENINKAKIVGAYATILYNNNIEESLLMTIDQIKMSWKKSKLQIIK